MPLDYSSAFTLPIYYYMKQDWLNITFHKFYIQTVVVNLIEGFTSIQKTQINCRLSNGIVIHNRTQRINSITTTRLFF